MEETSGDFSDSDSAESWTVINQKLKDEAVKLNKSGQEGTIENDEQKQNTLSNNKREDDTDNDGVSVITDEELDTVGNTEEENIQHSAISSSSLDHNNPIPVDEIPSVHPIRVSNIKADYSDDDDSKKQCFTNVIEDEWSEEFFSPTFRTYVHKKNKELSKLLNTVLIGSILITMCISIGHIWGTTDDCSPEMASSMSEMLYNMQELQHENFVLKSKIKLLESKNNKQNYMPLIFQNTNYKKQDDKDLEFNSKETSDVLKKEKGACLCDNQFRMDITNDILNSSDLQNESLANLNKNPTSDNMNIDAKAFSQLDASDDISNTMSNKIKQFESLPRKHQTKYKRSIYSTAQNTFLGPKTYNEFLKENSAKYYKNKHGKNSYVPKGNISNINYKKNPYNKDGKKFVKENFQNMKRKNKEAFQYKYPKDKFESYKKDMHYKKKQFEKEKASSGSLEKTKYDAEPKKNDHHKENVDFKNNHKKFKKHKYDFVPESHDKSNEKKKYIPEVKYDIKF